MASPRNHAEGKNIFFEQFCSPLVSRLKFLARKMRAAKEIHSHTVDRHTGVLKVITIKFTQKDFFRILSTCGQIKVDQVCKCKNASCRDKYHSSQKNALKFLDIKESFFVLQLTEKKSCAFGEIKTTKFVMKKKPWCQDETLFLKIKYSQIFPRMSAHS